MGVGAEAVAGTGLEERLASGVDVAVDLVEALDGLVTDRTSDRHGVA